MCRYNHLGCRYVWVANDMRSKCATARVHPTLRAAIPLRAPLLSPLPDFSICFYDPTHCEPFNSYLYGLIIGLPSFAVCSRIEDESGRATDMRNQCVAAAHLRFLRRPQHNNRRTEHVAELGLPSARSISAESTAAATTGRWPGCQLSIWISG